MCKVTVHRSFGGDRSRGGGAARWVGGFTLVELLVVIGIVGVLLSLLLPALSKARQQAQQVECGNRLRQLVNGSQMILTEDRKYPAPPVMLVGSVVPSAITVDLLNRVGRMLKWQEVSSMNTTLTLPVGTTCPSRDRVDLFQGSDPSFGVPYWITGFVYLGRLDEPGNTFGVVLKRERSAGSKGLKRAPLWGDTLTYARAGAVGGWSFFHGSRSDRFEPALGTLQDWRSIRGRHLGYTDGSVEWVPKKDYRLDATMPDEQASYRLTVPGAFTIWYYF